MLGIVAEPVTFDHHQLAPVECISTFLPEELSGKSTEAKGNEQTWQIIFRR